MSDVINPGGTTVAGATTIPVADAAAYVLSKFYGPISTMKLQKLLYFAQGWSLALLGRRLVDTEFQAWKWGPVSFDLFDMHRGLFDINELPQGDSANVEGNNRVIADAVIGNYGGLSGMQMGDLTHQPGTPWTIVRERAGVPKEGPCSLPIPDELIKAYFEQVLPKPSNAH